MLTMGRAKLKRLLGIGAFSVLFLLSISLALTVILQSQNRVKDRVEEIKARNTGKLAYMCRHNETARALVINKTAILPCKQIHGYNHTEVVRIFKITRRGEPMVSTYELISANDTRVIKYIEDFGFLLDLSSDLKEREKFAGELSYSCELVHKEAANTFINISLSFNESYVEVEEECSIPTVKHGEGFNSPRKFFCNTYNDPSDPVSSFEWVTSKFGGWHEPLKSVPYEPKENTTAEMIHRSKVSLVLTNTNLTAILCKVHRRNSTLQGIFPLHIHKAEKPVILYKDENTDLVEWDGPLQCIYRVHGNGNPEVKWLKDDAVVQHGRSDVPIKEDGEYRIWATTLMNPDSPRDKINYTCVISNPGGADSKSFIIWKRDWTLIIMTSIFPIIPFFILIGILFRYWKAYMVWKDVIRRLPKQAKEPNIDHASAVEMDGGSNGAVAKVNVNVSNSPPPEYVLHVIKAFKFSPWLNKTQSQLLFLDLITEINITHDLCNSNDPRVKYIVQYMGWSVRYLSLLQVYLVLQFYATGSLEKYLQRCGTDSRERNPYLYNDICLDFHRCNHDQRRSIQSHANVRGPVIAVSHLMKFMEQIACGFSYIEERGFVHRDIACRNILVQIDDSVGSVDNPHDAWVMKIADFGMARDINKGPYFLPDAPLDAEAAAKAKPRNMPIGLCSPETLRDHSFSSKSDVWSFGVLLWEICDLARVEPWEMYGRPAPEPLFRYLEQGHRLPQPRYIYVPEIWDLIQACWEWNPDDRPTFKEINARLQEINEEYNVYERDVEPEPQESQVVILEGMRISPEGNGTELDSNMEPLGGIIVNDIHSDNDDESNSNQSEENSENEQDGSEDIGEPSNDIPEPNENNGYQGRVVEEGNIAIAPSNVKLNCYQDLQTLKAMRSRNT